MGYEIDRVRDELWQELYHKEQDIRKLRLQVQVLVEKDEARAKEIGDLRALVQEQHRLVNSWADDVRTLSKELDGIDLVLRRVVPA